MIGIKYIDGDATNPIGEGNKLIIHCCNNIGLWGAGFVIALSKKWKLPEVQYRKWSKGYLSSPKFELGNVQFVKVGDGLVVGNMIGQHGVGRKNGNTPIRYSAIEKCLKEVKVVAEKHNASIHCPRFGAGLAGGDWSIIEQLLIDNLSSNDIPVIVYDF